MNIFTMPGWTMGGPPRVMLPQLENMYWRMELPLRITAAALFVPLCLSALLGWPWALLYPLLAVTLVVFAWGNPGNIQRSTAYQAQQLRRRRRTHGRGRPPHRHTIALRSRLEKDHKTGNGKDAPHYAKWLMETHPHLDLASARRTVYRELKIYQ